METARWVTTVYTVHQRKALDWLVNLGAQVRSYDTNRRLHAKAWFFVVDRFSTALASNLSKSRSSMVWRNVLSVGLTDVLEKFDATFESYWASRIRAFPRCGALRPRRGAMRQTC